MNWVAPSEKDTATNTLERWLCAAVDQFRANSGLNLPEASDIGAKVNEASAKPLLILCSTAIRIRKEEGN
ncbi:MAG TPA: hypothetical protein VGI03_04740 [Verrucomicrobiae bacterium]|jgi:hypothetical protein